MNHSKPSPPGIHGDDDVDIGSSSNQQHPMQRRATTTTIEHRPLGLPLRKGVEHQQQQQQTMRRAPTRRRASQDNVDSSSGIVRSFVATRQNSVKFRHNEHEWYEDSSCSGVDSIMSSVVGGLEVMDLRPNSAATLEHMRASTTSSLASLSSGGGSGNSAMSAPAVSMAGYLEPKFSRFFRVESNSKSKSKGSRPYKKKNSWLPKQWKEDSSLSSQAASEEEGEGANIGSSEASPSAAVMSLLRSSFSIGTKHTKVVAPHRPKMRRGSFDSDNNFSSEESDSNVSSGGSRVSVSDTSSHLWDQMEMSHNTMMSLSAMMDEDASVKKNLRRGRQCSNRGIFSRRGCVRIMVTVMGAMTLATLLYVVLEEGNSKLMFNAIADGSVDLFEKLFGNRHGSINVAGQTVTTNDTNQLRSRKLPKVGIDGVLETIPDAIPEDQANEVFYYKDDIATLESVTSESRQLYSQELETKEMVVDASSSEDLQVIPPVPAQVNKRVTVSTPPKALQSHRSKKKYGMTAQERNRKEHLERWKDY
mmetsp:Transcript_22923/g.47867  ORF Transcript_22923/g.47867 Transcript_22923/m.47867 type:complete len:532 (+) Transcript_22923:76-1671(+)